VGIKHSKRAVGEISPKTSGERNKEMGKYQRAIYILGLPVAMLLTVTLTSRVLAEGAASTTTDLEAQVAELQKRVDNLEEDLIWSQWHEQQVEFVVKTHLLERAISCRDTFCYQTDPTLYAFYPNHTGDLVYIANLLENGSWRTGPWDKGIWAVYATSSDGQETYTFLADEIHKVICTEGSYYCY
jgi:hypothetical protein